MDLSKLYRVAPIAKRLHLDRDEIMGAVKRGELEHYVTGCGVVLVKEIDVARWKLLKMRARQRVAKAKDEINAWRAGRN